MHSDHHPHKILKKNHNSQNIQFIRVSKFVTAIAWAEVVTYRAERRPGTETGLWLQLMCCAYVARRVQNLQKGVRPQLSEADESRTQLHLRSPREVEDLRCGWGLRW